MDTYVIPRAAFICTYMPRIQTTTMDHGNSLRLNMYHQQPSNRPSQTPLFSPQTIITGGTITQVLGNYNHHHHYQGA